jgi:hypothetical protein
VRRSRCGRAAENLLKARRWEVEKGVMRWEWMLMSLPGRSPASGEAAVEAGVGVETPGLRERPERRRNSIWWGLVVADGMRVRGVACVEAVIGVGDGAVCFVEDDDALVDAAVEVGADLVFVEMLHGDGGGARLGEGVKGKQS